MLPTSPDAGSFWAIDDRSAAAAVPFRRVLGIDVGIKRTGVALGDALGVSSRPLPTRTPASRAADVAYFVGLCAQHDVAVVVVGDPVMPADGSETPMAKRARGFARALSLGLAEAGRNTAVMMQNEVGSSIQASARLVQSGVKKKNRKAALDSEAARVMIEEIVATSEAIARRLSGA